MASLEKDSVDVANPTKNAASLDTKDLMVTSMTYELSLKSAERPTGTLKDSTSEMARNYSANVLFRTLYSGSSMTKSIRNDEKLLKLQKH